MSAIFTILALAVLQIAVKIDETESSMSEPSESKTEALEAVLNYRLPTNITPIRYTITLYLHSRDNFTGFYSLTLKATQKSNTIILNSANEHLEVISALLTYKNAERIHPKKWEKIGEFLIFYFDDELLGTYELMFHYESKFQDVAVSRNGRLKL